VDGVNALHTLHALRARFEAWLVQAAYPLWSERGIDPRNGGFVETLDQAGAPLSDPRRARVHPRQVYAFAQARSFGWQGDVSGIVRRGIDYFISCYRRPDGVYRALVDANGVPLSERALLYDQAFALLGYSAAATELDQGAELECRALGLRELIWVRFGAEDGSYYSEEQCTGVRESNPHLHLLEAYLGWAEIGQDARWADGVRLIAEFALMHFIRMRSGAIAESYLPTWEPTPDDAGRRIEPGHQFEWAWLLLRCERWHPNPLLLRDAALRLISIGEDFGVHNGVAVNALNDDFAVIDANARFWPQTERLKAALLAAVLTGDARYWSMAEAAAMSWIPYLDTAVSGLWLDTRLPSGRLVESPAPASTFYHLVGAVMALREALRDHQRR